MRYQWIARLLANPLLDCDAVMRPFAADAVRLLRLLYLEREAGRARAQERSDTLTEGDASRDERQLFEAEHGWRPAA